jgi:DNA-directed RNA polymerase specialized sigma24 family protein
MCFIEDVSEDARSLQYFSTPSHEEDYIFRVMGIEIAVKNFLLGAALDELEETRRDIILLAYCLEMTDQEIAESLHSIRRTITYRRSVALKQLKKLLEVQLNGKKKSGQKNDV